MGGGRGAEEGKRGGLLVLYVFRAKMEGEGEGLGFILSMFYIIIIVNSRSYEATANARRCVRVDVYLLSS